MFLKPIVTYHFRRSVGTRTHTIINQVSSGHIFLHVLQFKFAPATTRVVAGRKPRAAVRLVTVRAETAYEAVGWQDPLETTVFESNI